MSNGAAISILAVFAATFAIQGPVLFRALRRGELNVPILGSTKKDEKPAIFWCLMVSIIGTFSLGAWINPQALWSLIK